MSQGETVSHTPGPWHFEKVAGRYEIWKKDDGTPHTYCAIVQTQTDARLIAAAPDLLEACKVAFANLKNLYSSDHLVIKSLRNALEKAGAL